MKTKTNEEIIVHEGRRLKVIEVMTDGKSREEIEFDQWSDEKYCLKAVENNGDALRYVKEQSEAVCLKAVENNGDALRYVKEQSEAACLKAVENNGNALQYVKEQSEAVCLKAVESDGDALRYVKVKAIFMSILTARGAKRRVSFIKRRKNNMKTQTLEVPAVKVGQLFYTSWGYDQTNYDFLIVESISPSGKTAICRMAEASGPANNSMGQILTAHQAPYGESFRMKISSWEGRLELRGSYPYTQGDKQLRSFWSVEPGKTFYSTGYA